MIIIFHIRLLLTLITIAFIIYHRYFRFSRKSVINNLISKHYNEIKDKFNDAHYLYEVEINLGFTKDNEEIIPKMIAKMQRKGFTVRRIDRDNCTCLYVK